MEQDSGRSLPSHLAPELSSSPYDWPSKAACHPSPLASTRKRFPAGVADINQKGAVALVPNTLCNAGRPCPRYALRDSGLIKT
jgi:hypothetical protein